MADSCWCCGATLEDGECPNACCPEGCENCIDIPGSCCTCAEVDEEEEDAIYDHLEDEEEL